MNGTHARKLSRPCCINGSCSRGKLPSSLRSADISTDDDHLSHDALYSAIRTDHDFTLALRWYGVRRNGEQEDGGAS